MSEKSGYCEAIDKFAEAMKERMIQKEEEGFSGWDSSDFDDHNIPARIYGKARKLMVLGKNLNKKHLVDIANFAMILWSKIGRFK